MSLPVAVIVNGIKYLVDGSGSVEGVNGWTVWLFVIGKKGLPTKKARVGAIKADGSVVLGSWLPSGMGICAS